MELASPTEGGGGQDTGQLIIKQTKRKQESFKEFL